jgi:hypothetical protein
MNGHGRDSLEIPRREHDPENQELGGIAERATAGAEEYSHCSSAADRSASCCRFLALTVSSCSSYDAWT